MDGIAPGAPGFGWKAKKDCHWTNQKKIVFNNRPLALHETLQWFQRQLNLPLLVLESEALAGKRVYATRMPKSGFELQHQDCFEDYKQLLAEVDL